MPCSVSCLATQPPLAPEPTITASKSCLLAGIDECAWYHCAVSASYSEPETAQKCHGLAAHSRNTLELKMEEWVSG